MFFSTIGVVASSILTVIMVFILITSGVSSNVGNGALLNKSLEIQQKSNM